MGSPAAGEPARAGGGKWRGQQLLQAAEVGRLVADDRRVQRLCGRRAGWRDGLTSRATTLVSVRTAWPVAPVTAVAGKRLDGCA